MYLYSTDKTIKKYATPEDILIDYYELRLEYYQKRKEYLLVVLQKELDILDIFLGLPKIRHLWLSFSLRVLYERSSASQ